MADSMKTPSELLVRPRMHADEWSKGFVVRTALANGLPTHSSATLENISTSALPCNLSAQKALQIEHLLGAAIPSWALVPGSTHTRIKVCWHCLKEFKYFPATWRLHRFSICPKHAALLQFPNLGNGSRTTLEALLVWAAQTAAKAPSNHPTDEVSPEELFAYQGLWRPVVDGGAPTDPISLACALLLSEIFVALARARRGRDGHKPGSPEWQRGELWKQKNIQPQATIEGVEKLLESLVIPVRRAAAYRLLLKIKNAELSAPSIMSQLPLEKWLDALRLQTQRMSGRGAGGGIPEEALRSEGVLINTLATELGVHRKRIYSAINFCGIRPSHVVERSRRFQLISRADIARITMHLDQLMTPNEMVDVLHLTFRRCTSRTLRLANLLQTRGRGHSLMYTRSSVAGLLASLNERAISAPTNHRWLRPIDDFTIFHKRNANVIRELFQDVFELRVPLYRTKTDAGLNSFAVPIDVLTRLERRSAAYAARPQRDPRQLELTLC